MIQQHQEYNGSGAQRTFSPLLQEKAQQAEWNSHERAVSARLEIFVSYSKS